MQLRDHYFIRFSSLFITLFGYLCAFHFEWKRRMTFFIFQFCSFWHHTKHMRKNLIFFGSENRSKQSKIDRLELEWCSIGNWYIPWCTCVQNYFAIVNLSEKAIASKESAIFKKNLNRIINRLFIWRYHQLIAFRPFIYVHIYRIRHTVCSRISLLCVHSYAIFNAMIIIHFISMVVSLERARRPNDCRRKRIVNEVFDSFRIQHGKDSFSNVEKKKERHRHNFEIEIIHLVKKNEGSLRHVWKCRRERDAWIVLILFGFETIFFHSRVRDLSHSPIATLSVCPWLCYGCLLRLGINWLLPLVAFVVTYRGWIMFRKNEHQQMNTHTHHTILTIEIAHHRKKRKRNHVLLFDATSLIDCHSM